MRQITESELRFIIRYEVSRIPKGVIRDLASGHQDTSLRGRDAAASCILKRMSQWEILIDEPAQSAFEASVRLDAIRDA